MALLAIAAMTAPVVSASIDYLGEFPLIAFRVEYFEVNAGLTC